MGAGGGGKIGGTVQVGGQFADMDGLEKSSSDGLAKDVLIWLHSALIQLSPSSGKPMSISGTNSMAKHRRKKKREQRESTFGQK